MTFRAIDKTGGKIHSSLDKSLLCAYISAEGILFFLIKWAEITQPYRITGKVMYSAIVLNFCVMAYFFLRYRGDFRVPLAMTVTLVADYFLTYTDSHFYRGVSCFILVQLIYGWRLGYRLRDILWRGGLFLFFSCLLRGLGANSAFSVFCACSIALLLGNVICSWILVRGSNERIYFMLALGLTLFAGCDLSIGLRTLSQDSSSLLLFHSVMNYLTWIFYIPAQVLLNLSYILE